MDIGIQIILFLEMLCVNIAAIHCTAKHKYSNPVTFLVLFGFSILFFGFCLFLGYLFNFHGTGSGAFMVLGFLYFIPLFYLYKETISRTLSIMCCAWIYTMLIFVFSVQVGHWFPQHAFLVRLLVQTALYGVTLRSFFRFVTGKIQYILDYIPPFVNRYLLLESILWFLILVVLNLSLLTNHPIFHLLTLVFLGAVAVMSYQLLHKIVASSNDIASLLLDIHTDALTGLRNRKSLFEEADHILKSKQPFSILFMDLDAFKHINDKYGHLLGDEYLCCFSNHMTALLGSMGQLYRIAGDEFIFLQKDGTVEETLKCISDFRWQDGPCPFIGVSVGYASYPLDASTFDKLIAVADARMYQNKKKTRVKY